MNDEPNAKPNPWSPMSTPLDLKVVGKLLEELGEAVSAASRCLIQGIDEVQPITHKPNRLWLEEELADVMATIGVVINHFKLDQELITKRIDTKVKHLLWWNDMPVAPLPLRVVIDTLQERLNKTRRLNLVAKERGDLTAIAVLSLEASRLSYAREMVWEIAITSGEIKVTDR